MFKCWYNSIGCILYRYLYVIYTMVICCPDINDINNIRFVNKVYKSNNFQRWYQTDDYIRRRPYRNVIDTLYISRSSVQ